MRSNIFIGIFVSFLLLTASLSVKASDDGLREALAERCVGIWKIAEDTYRNPVVNQWRLYGSLTSVGAGYENSHHSPAPDPRDGNGEYALSAGAETYTRYKTSTLWGDASYTAGKRHNVVWNETADSYLLYPYLLADSVGGDLNNEVYRFRGGYADTKGRLAWGGELSYTALLQYRSVDPRPRNVSGTLDISAGVMGKVWREYMLGGTLYFRKYKQTNDVEFKSEMGVDKIFHLTGLGQHYNRWAGTGLSTYYDGYRYGLSIDLYPADSRGLCLNVKGSSFTCSNIISDLNKLPMAKIWHNELNVGAGWLQPGQIHEWGAGGRLTVYRRHGIENIFGDAASAVYPLIGSNEMYADNSVSAHIDLMWVRNFRSGSRLGISLSPEWSHRTEAYVEPYSYKALNWAGATAAVNASIGLGKRWNLCGKLSMAVRSPYDCTINLNPSGLEPGLYEAERGAYLKDSSLSGSLTIGLSATYLFSPCKGINLGISREGSRVKGLMNANTYMINLNFLFI